MAAVHDRSANTRSETAAIYGSNNLPARSSKTRRQRKAENDYRRRLSKLKEAGIYAPKGDDDLTEWRKREINKKWRDYRQFVDDPRKRFFFVGTDGLTSKERKEFLKNAESLNIKTTKTGLFLQREGQRKAKIVWDGKHKEYDIELSGKVKWGQNKGKRIKHRIPIAPVDRVEGELDRLEDKARAMGPLKKGEAISFIVVENDEMTGASRSTFHDPATLRRKLSSYHVENKGHALAFLRLVVVQKTTLTAWAKEHKPRAKKMARRQPIKRREITWNVINMETQKITDHNLQREAALEVAARRTRETDQRHIIAYSGD